MSAQPAPGMRTDRDADVPLCSVSVHGRVRGLLFELSVEQSYENNSKRNVEAVYAFPVPLRAALLGLEMQIGDRQLTAVVARKEAAEEKYERAVSEGHTAALLERSGDGLYTLSIGNLMAGERAVIRYRYAELLDRSGEYVRLRIPTVIAPRYGAPEAHGLAPHQRPATDLTVEYPLEVSIDLEGEIANAAVSCPSHAVTVARTETGTRLGLAKGATLDRDFILEMRGAATRAQAVVARDDAEYVAIVSLAPEITQAPARLVALNVVLDCSGSMGGDSISAAKRALLAVMERLTPEDHVSITRFGDAQEHVSKGFQAARPETVETLKHAIAGIDSDMGGTEMAGAIQAALAIRAPSNAQRDLLLITDAEVWASDELVELVAQSKYRLFVVAVGAAPNEALARQLSERTGGACEFVSPNEDAEAAIVRMFQRMREVPRTIGSVTWPAVPVWEVARPDAVFSGDVVHLIAAFRERPEGVVRMSIVTGNGSVAESTCSLAGEALDRDAVARLGIARRIETLPDDEAAELAERYQIGSRHTSFVLVHKRAEGERAESLPELKTVRQMLAAGWGGSGSAKSFSRSAGEVVCSVLPAAPIPRVGAGLEMNLPNEEDDWAQSAERVEPWRPKHKWAPQSAPAVLVALLQELDQGGRMPKKFKDLQRLGVPASVMDALWELELREGFVAERVVLAFIALLAERYAQEIGSDDARQLVAGVFDHGAHRILRQVLEPMTEWAVPEMA